MFHTIINENDFHFQETILSHETIKKEFTVNPFGKYLIYEEKNQIIGYIYYSEIYERIEINQFEVDSLHRGCGIGSKLLKYLLEHVDKGITLEVSCKNEIAIHLYQKFRFSKKAIRKGYYDGVDGILMEKQI